MLLGGCVIGWSFTVENIIKGIYENSIGRFTEWLAGDTQVAEDIYAYKVANDYATFIYDYPWYDFSYSSALIGVWTLDNEKDYTWLQDVRRLERKLILTVEYGIKATYSSVIAFATHTKFGVQDDVIYAVVTRDDGRNYELIKAPHYHPFTRLLLSKLEEESNNKDFRIINISGNNKITFTYRDQAGAVAVDGTKEIDVIDSTLVLRLGAKAAVADIKGEKFDYAAEWDKLLSKYFIMIYFIKFLMRF